jgi:hypothetical protein
LGWANARLNEDGRLPTQTPGAQAHTHLEHERERLLFKHEEGEDSRRANVPEEEEANAKPLTGPPQLVEDDLRREDEGEADGGGPPQDAD